ncbi:MAG: FkbM family methyltransferase [Flavobacteriia bacterium]|nr:FkbM family methyltransferase [Flavobacteriia bacterium]OJX35923.1 MAG: hypothetical protein BGO87_05475 [Flavobacteriia bacterium 40-80]
MKKVVKTALYKILGLKNYLRLLYRSLAFAIDSGFLKKNPSYLLHQFTQKIIQKDDHVLDIGANLGYYTRMFLKAVGGNGKVYAVEPVKPFYENITYFLGNHRNLVLYNYALGTEEKEIQLSVPDQYGYLRTGLPKVYDENNPPSAEKLLLFPAKMIRGSILFREIQRLDYLKMDVEGYEKYIIPEIKELLERTFPCIQIEISGDSKPFVEETLFTLGYETYFYKDGQLTQQPVADYAQDYFYIHPSKKLKYQHLIS